MVYYILRFLSFVIFKSYFRLEVIGRKNIPLKGGFILASNHISYLDPIAIGVASFRRLNFMARHDLFSIPLFSSLLTAVGAFPVKRGYADIAALREAMRRVKDGNALVLFPEGRRVEANNELDKPEAGIGFLVSKLNVPVIPAFVKGSEKAFPKGAKFILPKKIYVNFGKQIHVERRMPYQDTAQLIMENIRHLSC